MQAVGRAAWMTMADAHAAVARSSRQACGACAWAKCGQSPAHIGGRQPGREEAGRTWEMAATKAVLPGSVQLVSCARTTGQNGTEPCAQSASGGPAASTAACSPQTPAAGCACVMATRTLAAAQRPGRPLCHRERAGLTLCTRSCPPCAQHRAGSGQAGSASQQTGLGLRDAGQCAC